MAFKKSFPPQSIQILSGGICDNTRNRGTDQRAQLIAQTTDTSSDSVSCVCDKHHKGLGNKEQHKDASVTDTCNNRKNHSGQLGPDPVGTISVGQLAYNQQKSGKIIQFPGEPWNRLYSVIILPASVLVA